MASTNKTINYELNQWLGNDYIKREDFNNDNELIDSALKANADAITSEAAARAAGDSALEDLVSTKLDKTASPNGNLLHNWDFVNALVNQKMQDSYISTVTWAQAIDRWKIMLGTVTVFDGFINFTSNTIANYKRIIQFTEKMLRAGQTYTLTLHCKMNAGSGTLVLRPCDSMYSSISGSNGRGLISAVTPGIESYVTYTFTPAVDVTNFGVEILCGNTLESSIDIDIYRWKLELGSVSTLANDPPVDYGEQLALCQRYYQIIDVKQIGVGFAESATGIWVSFGFPVKMRTTPTVSVLQYPHFSLGNIPSMATTWVSVTPSGLNAVFTVTGVTQYRPYACNDNINVFAVSAEL